MNQHQNSPEDWANYHSRAFGVDANMKHDLANRIVKSVEAENQRLRDVLALYSDPFMHIEKIEEETTIPDFYGETDFGMFARAALKGQS